MRDYIREDGAERPSTLPGHGHEISYYEVGGNVGGRFVITAFDPERAHAAVDDPGYKKFVPNCGLCQAKALAAQQAGNASTEN